MAVRLDRYTQQRFFLVGLLFFLFSLGAQAQQEVKEMETERPDQAQASSVVPKGTVQLEAGYFYQKYSEETVKERLFAYPQALLRYGLLDRLELRVQGALKDSVLENGTRRKIRGFGPLGVGAKVSLWEESGWRPEAAVIVMVALPVGSKVYQPDNPEPEVRLALSNELTENLQLTYNLIYGRIDHSNVTGYAANLSNSFADWFTAYVEVFGSKSAGEQAEHQFDIGLMFKVLPNLQLDIAAGRQLNSAAPDHFITTGFSVRLPR